MKIHKWYRTSIDSGEFGLGDNKDGKLNKDSQNNNTALKLTVGESGLGDNRDGKMKEDSQMVQDFN